VDLLTDLGDLVIVVVVIVVAVVVVVLGLVVLGVAREAVLANEGRLGVGKGGVEVSLEKGVVALDGAGGILEDTEVDGLAVPGAVGTDVGSVAVFVAIVEASHSAKRE